MSNLFEDMKDFNEDVSRWDVSKVEKMSKIFEGAASFNKEYIKGWSTEGRNMKFTNKELKQAVKDWCDNSITAEVIYGQISGWDVSETTDMSGLFEDMKDFNEDISRWDVSKVEKMSRIFKGATSLNKEYVKNWSGQGRNKKHTDEELKQAVNDWWDDSIGVEAFYGHISSWDVSEVTDTFVLLYWGVSRNLGPWINKVGKKIEKSLR